MLFLGMAFLFSVVFCLTGLFVLGALFFAGYLQVFPDVLGIDYVSETLYFLLPFILTFFIACKVMVLQQTAKKIEFIESFNNQPIGYFNFLRYYFGFFWRFLLMQNVIFTVLEQALVFDYSGLVGFLFSLFSVFCSFLWLFMFPYGKIKVKFIGDRA